MSGSRPRRREGAPHALAVREPPTWLAPEGGGPTVSGCKWNVVRDPGIIMLPWIPSPLRTQAWSKRTSPPLPEGLTGGDSSLTPCLLPSAFCLLPALPPSPPPCLGGPRSGSSTRDRYAPQVRWCSVSLGWPPGIPGGFLTRTWSCTHTEANANRWQGTDRRGPYSPGTQGVISDPTNQANLPAQPPTMERDTGAHFRHQTPRSPPGSRVECESPVDSA